MEIQQTNEDISQIKTARRMLYRYINAPSFITGYVGRQTTHARIVLGIDRYRKKIVL